MVGAAYVGLVIAAIICVAFGKIDSPFIGGKALWIPAFSIGAILITDSVITILWRLLAQRCQVGEMKLAKLLTIGFVQGGIFLPLSEFTMLVWQSVQHVFPVAPFFVDILILAVFDGLVAFLLAYAGYCLISSSYRIIFSPRSSN